MPLDADGPVGGSPLLLHPLSLISGDPQSSIFWLVRSLDPIARNHRMLVHAPSRVRAQSFHDNTQFDLQGTLLQFGWHSKPRLAGITELIEDLPGEAHHPGDDRRCFVWRVRASVASCLKDVHSDVDVSSAFRRPQNHIHVLRKFPSHSLQH